LSRPRRTIAAAAVVLMAMILLAAGCANDGSSKINLKIGTLLPLTGQRDQLGEAGKDATKLAQAQIDTAIRKNGSAHTVTTISTDEGPDPGVTVNSASKLKDDKAFLLLRLDRREAWP